MWHGCPRRVVMCVSILTRRTGRVQHFNNRTLTAPQVVSILTRRTGRVQRCQSGAYPCRCRCFNPHPAHWPSATLSGRPRRSGDRVSILTRRTGRVQRPRFAGDPVLSEFQSSPGALAGCNMLPHNITPEICVFQSSPGALAGCNAAGHDVPQAVEAVSILTRRTGRVQQGDTIAITLVVSFQSSPGALAGCNVANLERTRAVADVSILTRRTGRVQLSTA